jgi:hypothetical protein
MQRRDVLRALGAAAAISVLPRDAEAAWAAVARRRLDPAAGRALDAARTARTARTATIAAIADAIIPRTDTLGAADVGVGEFVDAFVAGWFTETERAEFLSGIDAIDDLARLSGGAPFAALASEPRDALLRALDQPADRRTSAARAFARLKGLVVHGYFTSERVQKEVLKADVMPGRWDGDAPMAARRPVSGRPND